MKVVINKCFGGFGLSPIAIEEYLKRKGKKVFFYKQTKYGFQGGEEEYTRTPVENVTGLHFYTLLPGGNDIWFSDSDIKRGDKDLIAVVEEMGEKANGECAELSIVEIPDGIEYEIDEYDGLETVEEKHRTWG
jgi:hypothetical protein